MVSAPIRITERRDIWEKFSPMICSFCSKKAMAVSYTHLDVYKRQAWDTEPQYPLDEIDSLEISGSAFVLTGDFQNCDGDRNQVKEMIEAKGGRCTGAVSGKTNYLVLGDFGSAGAKKIDQVMEQRAKGKDIKIIAEYDLFRFL